MRQCAGSRPHNFNDLVASIIDDSGQWQVCVDVLYRGGCVVCGHGEYRSVCGWHDQISSARMLSRWPETLLEARFKKKCGPITRGSGLSHGDDRDHRGHGGNAKAFRASTSALWSRGSNSSYVVRRGSHCVPAARQAVAPAQCGLLPITKVWRVRSALGVWRPATRSVRDPLAHS